MLLLAAVVVPVSEIWPLLARAAKPATSIPSPTVSLTRVVAVDPLRPMILTPPEPVFATMLFTVLPVPLRANIPDEFVETEAVLSPEITIASAAELELEI